MDTLLSGTVGDKALRKLRDRIGEEWPAVLAGLREDGHHELALAIESRLVEIDSDPPPTPEALINGSDLIALGVTPGPELGRLIGWVDEQQRSGQLHDRDAAIEAVRRRITR